MATGLPGLLSARVKAKVSRQALASEVNRSYLTIYRLEMGLRDASQELLVALAARLGVTESDLLHPAGGAPVVTGFIATSVALVPLPPPPAAIPAPCDFLERSFQASPVPARAASARAFPAARFWDRVSVTASGCWEWKGEFNRNGYGRFTVGARKVMAHRLAYELLHLRKVPRHLKLDHLCRNRACVCPAHLQPVSNRTNTLRGTGPSALNARKRTCPRGHQLTKRPDGRGRRCYTCEALARRTRAHREAS